MPTRAPATICYLDADDEITTAVGRLRSAEQERVLLVLPPGSRIATSRINFRLLAMEARQHRRRLAIVAGDPGVRAIAASAGLAAYASVAEYEAASEEGSETATDHAPGSGAGGAGASGVGGAAIGGSAPADASAEAVGGSPLERIAARWDSIGVGRPSVDAAGPGEPAAAVGPRSGLDRQAAVARPSWRERGRRLRWPLVALLVLLIGLSAFAAYLLLPSATIAVTPRVEPVGPVRLAVVADPDVRRPDLSAGLVPATRLEIPLSVRDEFRATGVKVTETMASGVVRFRSENTLFDVTVPAGTRVSTESGTEFVTTAPVVVPRASFATGPTSKDAAIEAVRAGPGGNVAAGAVTREPGTLQAALISVTNPAGTSGGTRQETRFVSRKDYDAAVKALTERVAGQFSAALQDPATVPNGLRLFPDTARRGRLAAEPTAGEAVGTRADSFELAVSGTGTATAVDESAVGQLALARLRQSVPAGHELFPDSLATEVGKGTPRGENVEYAVEARREQWRPVRAEALLAEVKGRKVSDARRILAQYGSAEVQTWPAYVDWVPTLDFRLAVTVRDPRRSK